MIKSECSKFIKKTLAMHNHKLLLLWFKQQPRSPNCILNLSDRKLVVEEMNVLYRGLKHHILPYKINVQILKVEIEKLLRKLNPEEDKTTGKKGPLYQII